MSARKIRLLGATLLFTAVGALSSLASAEIGPADFDENDDSYGTDYVYEESAEPSAVAEENVAHVPAPVCRVAPLHETSLSAIRVLNEQVPSPAPRPTVVAVPVTRPPAIAARPAPPLPPRRPLEAPSCALDKILASAKISVRNRWGNRPSSGGLCALGVRGSLQASNVGGVSGGLGNAIDFVKNLKPHGFVDTGIRDPNRAPPGAIIVFEGPNTRSYLRGGGYGYPAGNWLGHVTIKGDDGFYYTDGRTHEPAVGWSGGQNRRHVRNVAGIFVPGPALTASYAGKCTQVRLASGR